MNVLNHAFYAFQRNIILCLTKLCLHIEKKNKLVKSFSSENVFWKHIFFVVYGAEKKGL